MTIVTNTSNVLLYKYKKTPVKVVLAFFLLVIPSLAQAQVCDNDGIVVAFDENNGAVELRDVRVREITGNRRNDIDVSIVGPGIQSANWTGSEYAVNGLSSSAFPDNGIGSSQVRRRERRVWEARFPRGMYEFNNRNNLNLELVVTVAGGQASHINGGAASVVTLAVADLGTNAQWYGGNPRSLRRLRGHLQFRYTDFMQLSMAGIHRADVSVCVNVRGNI
ncbi:MAG: hypothetical protein GKR91_01340 [Pseudomonadales bacterium]|nr:hypothetical protein [Pseudomonadales bacterium]